MEKVRALSDLGDSSRSAYADAARRYQEVARYLKELKNDYRRFDELPRKCEEKTRELADRLRRFTDTHDPRGIEQVPHAARELGRFGKEAIAEAEGARRLAYERYDRIDDFSDSADRWSDVRSNLHAAARTMYEHTVRINEQIKRDDVCGNLAKEDRNPLAEQAMQKLLEGKKGIEGSYAALDSLLAEMGGHLDGLVGDNNDADIQYAEAKLDQIEHTLDQLDRIKGNDEEARRRIETWRTIGRTAREAFKQLRILKQAQFLADNAPRKCKDTTDRLREIIRRYVDARDVGGQTEIREHARRLATPIHAGLEKTKAQHVIMERALADALRFDPSEGRWPNLRDRYRVSANAIFEYWRKAKDLALEQCTELAKSEKPAGQQSDMVEKAVRELGQVRSAAQNDLAQLVTNHERWNASIRELRGWYKQDTAAVRDAFCKLEESPGDDAVAGAYIAQLESIVNRMRDRLRPKWGEINSGAADLYAAVDRLKQQSDADVRQRAGVIAGMIRKRLQSLANLLNNELHGANDPEFRAWIEVGKNEHKRIQHDSSKCQASEITIPGAGMRIDCVYVSSGTCYIVEIKPNNSDARAKGDKQAADYIDAMNSYFSRNKNDIDNAFQSKLAIFKRASCMEPSS